MQVAVTTLDQEDAGTIELNPAIFEQPVRSDILHAVVRWQLARKRQGTHKTKTRGEVAGGGKKPYKQKGTGRARQGSIRAPQFAGGGVVHGPVPRDYSQRTPKKMKVAALRGALSDRVRAGQLHVVTGVVGGETPSTKQAKTALRNWTEAKKVLVVLNRNEEENSWLSLRNLQNVHLIDPGQLNTYDVLNSDDVVFTKAAFDRFVAGPVKGRSVKAAASSAEGVPQNSEGAEQ
jgi:large subunit ribosomal protein L4